MVSITGGDRMDVGFLNGLQLQRLTPADLDHDGIVDITDFLALLGAWGDCPELIDCPADIDHDGMVDISDFLMLLGDWD